MKKGMLSFIMVLAIMMVLSACGTSQETSGGESSDGGEKKEKLRVVTEANYAPFEYQERVK